MLNSIKMMYVTYFNTSLVSTVLALFSCFHIYSTLRRLFRRYWLFLLISMRTPIRLLFGSIYQIKSTVTNEFWVLWIFGSSSEKSLTAGTAYCAKISNASNQFWSFSMGMKNQINDLRIRYISLMIKQFHFSLPPLGEVNLPTSLHTRQIVVFFCRSSGGLSWWFVVAISMIN